MEHRRTKTAAGRAHTDASLGAERASMDAVHVRQLSTSQRVLDDLIERDRIIADERLMKFRRGADRTLAHDRAETAAPNSAVAVERHAADVRNRAEREDTDALVERERQRADDVVHEERRGHEAQLARLDARREETDTRLLSERRLSDATADALDENVANAKSADVRHTDILGVVTHDLRSPLSVIALNAQCIVECTEEPSTREAAEDMVRAAARMERLLSDLLDVARVESGVLRLDKRPHDAATLVAEVLDSYRPLCAARGISLAGETPRAAAMASFDHDRIIQVLSNLLGNALKFTPAKGTIDLSLEQHVDHVEFVVRDNGGGIHRDALAHVFERFWQIDSETRRGLGLGLFICEQIVRGHGGRIWVESELGNGATFRFTLPRL